MEDHWARASGESQKWHSGQEVELGNAIKSDNLAPSWFSAGSDVAKQADVAQRPWPPLPPSPQAQPTLAPAVLQELQQSHLRAFALAVPAGTCPAGTANLAAFSLSGLNWNVTSS